MPRPSRSWLIPALLLAAGLVLRAILILHHAAFTGDAPLYADLAQNMVRHHIFGFTEAARIRPTLIRLPGFPLFLAACFIPFGMGNFMAVLWVQLLLALAECCLLASLAARLMGRRAALFTLGLAALCPFTAVYTALPITEATSLFCVTLAFFSLERWNAARGSRGLINHWLLPLGFALSLAILLRPDQALLAVAIVPAVLWLSFRNERIKSPRRLAPTAIVTLIIALPLLLWAARNWRVFHVVQPLAPRYANDPGEMVSYGFQRWYRTWAIDWKSTLDVYWAYDGSLLSLTDLPPRAIDNPTQGAETTSLYAEYNNLSSTNPQIDHEFGQIADQRFALHPVRYYLWIPLAKVADMWLRPRTEGTKLPVDWWRWREHPGKSLLCAGYALVNLAYIALAAVGLWRWRRQAWSGQRALAYAMLAFIVLRDALLWTVDNSEPRYTLECFPIVILLAGFAFARVPPPPSTPPMPSS